MDLTNFSSIKIPEGNVEKIVDNVGRILWENNNYLYAEAVEDGTVRFEWNRVPSSLPVIEYSVGSKNSFSEYTYGTDISLSVGQKVYFKGDNEKMSSADNNLILKSSNKIKVGGNVMSILDSTCKLKKVPERAFRQLFANNSKLISIENLKLPATELARDCYGFMFFHDTGLNYMPEELLPAPVLAEYCYQNMFSYCDIREIPSNLLRATSLAPNCYSYMFSSNYNLKTLPSDLFKALEYFSCSCEAMFDETGMLMSETQVDKYTRPFRIPYQGTGEAPLDAFVNMFRYTDGIFSGTPEINKTYYLWEES
ncbi:MAG: hypothetical protein KBT35_01235 [Firmicutes bacterium]|nr:hypothetical protein [Candidatus Colivicinus equi]